MWPPNWLMGPPSYPDLGKNARDVFGKGYHFGLLKLDLKTKTKSNVEFSSGGVSNQDSGKVFGSLETKYRVKEYGKRSDFSLGAMSGTAPDLSIAILIMSDFTRYKPCHVSKAIIAKWNNILDQQVKYLKKLEDGKGTDLRQNQLRNIYSGQLGFLQKNTNRKETTSSMYEREGLTFSEKWNTDNTLATEIAIQDQIAQGLKLSFDTTFAPQTGSKTGRIKSAFQNDSVALNCDIDLNLSGPIVQASAVLGYNGWLAGYQSKFDSQRSKITQNNVALGYSTGDFILHTNVNDGQEFGGSIYQRVSPKLETGIQLAWTAGSNDTRFGIGAKYDLDKDAAVRAKVNNASQIGLGYQQKLREGITLTLSALIDGKNFNQGGHKIGVALELEA
uniref:Voltage-dependent anion-selective channel n=1 Tax=Timema monikensis TaxID=170555 RepID=A0A7R9EDV0_9NEOP|nr:unnamed protein product [Timema monikensis]